VIGRLDHLVLTTRQRESCIDFYTRVLGMRLDTFGQGRVAFRFGDQKINLHEAGREFERSLQLAPRRALSLLGLARAATMAGDREAAARAHAELRKIWHRADGDVPWVQEVARQW